MRAKRLLATNLIYIDAGDSCDSGISVLYNCLSWCKFTYTHLYHSRQLYNIQITTDTNGDMSKTFSTNKTHVPVMWKYG